MGEIRSGVDTSTVCTASPLRCLKQLGFSFVIRYYRSRDSAVFATRLTADEARLISGAGLKIGVVFEFRATMAEFTPAQAKGDAQDALEQAIAVGQPGGSAIYFAVDFEPPTSRDITGPIAAYFRIAQSMLRPEFRVGVYGSGAVCSALLDAELVDFTWLSQSVGFPGTAGFTRWNVRQGGRHRFCAPLDTDIDDAHGGFGEFTIEVP